MQVLKVGDKYLSIDGKLLSPSTVGEGIISVNSIKETQVPIDWLRKGQDTDGSIYNTVGYIIGYRLNSGGGLTEAPDGLTTGFIPVKKGDIIRLDGFFMCGNIVYVNGLRGVDPTSNLYLEYYVELYSSTYTRINGEQLKLAWKEGDEYISLYGGIKCYCDSNGVVDHIDLSDILDTVAYVRLNSWTLDMNVDNAKITIDGSTETKQEEVTSVVVSNDNIVKI